MNAANVRYYAKNREKVRAYQAKRYVDNRDKLSADNAKWSKANPEKVRAKSHRWRARKANAQGDHTAAQLKARFDYHGNKCIYCNSTENHHADHMIPLSRGGANWPSNMVPACASCNISKGAKTPEEFLLQQFNIAMEKMING